MKIDILFFLAHESQSLIYSLVELRHQEFKFFYFLLVLCIELSSLKEVFVGKIDRHFLPANILKKRTKIKTVLIKKKIHNCEMVENEVPSLTVL